MAEYQQLKSTSASLASSSVLDSSESRVFSDDERVDVDDFASFKGYTPKDTTQALDGMGENYDSMVMEKRDDDDFIVVRSQESFLKERVEHLTKSNSLLEYLIRSLEKDLSNKTIELQKMISKLEGEKAHSVKVEEDCKKSLAELENMVLENNELKKKVEDQEQKLISKLEDEKAHSVKIEEDCKKSLAELENMLRENNELKKKVEDLELVKAKQASEIKNLEEELRNSVRNLNNLDSKIQNEREAIAAKEQKYILALDKIKLELIEMHARLEQSRVEYANLYRKNQSLQKEVARSREIQTQTDAAQTASIGTITSNGAIIAGPSTKSLMITMVPAAVKDSMDEIDMRLQQLEKEIDAQKPDEIESMMKKAKIVESQQSTSSQGSLLIDIESEQHNTDTLLTTSIEPVVEANTSPKTLILSPSAPPAPKTSVSIPCIMCDEVIKCRQHEDGSGQMHEMVNHLELIHHQKMCPVCSTLFDTRLPIFSTYFANHIQNHFNNIKYPNLN